MCLVMVYRSYIGMSPAAQVRCFNTLELLLALNALPQQLAALKVRGKQQTVSHAEYQLYHMSWQHAVSGRGCLSIFVVHKR